MSRRLLPKQFLLLASERTLLQDTVLRLHGIDGDAHRLSSATKSTRDLDFLRLDATAFASCSSELIDYAVMERATGGVTVQADIGWSDVGSWAALWEIAEKDAEGNVDCGDVHLHNAGNCFIRAEN